MEKVNCCRSCGQAFPPEPLLRCSGMPAAAQHLPESPGDDRGVDFSLMQCGGCGLVQLDTPPVPYYREVIRAAAFSPEMGAFRREQFRDWVGRNRLEGKRVLECGCGRGEFLSLMAEAGVVACGMEYGEENVRECRKCGLTVERLYFEDGSEKLADGPFDGFYILNYLEHLPNLGAYLAGIRDNLNDGGAGLVEVPNFDMILANRTFAEFTTDHLYYFTRQTLAGVLERAGFDVVAERTVWYGYILSLEVRKRPRLDLSGFDAARRELSDRLNGLVEKYGPEHSAVWGASHQAFAVLALAGLHGRLRCIIDSAPFKQGKISPATHIPIVAPDAVTAKDLRLLIVMAGGYSSEVAALARKRYGNGPAVFILRENALEESS